MRLSEHFTTEEFDCHDGTAVPVHARDDLRALCRELLEPLRGEFGRVTIISGYRTPAHNRSVGGAPHSFHVYRRDRRGAAADLKCARGTPADWYRWLDRHGAPGLGRYSTHTHVDNRVGRARW